MNFWVMNYNWTIASPYSYAPLMFHCQVTEDCYFSSSTFLKWDFSHPHLRTFSISVLYLGGSTQLFRSLGGILHTTAVKHHTLSNIHIRSIASSPCPLLLRSTRVLRYHFPQLPETTFLVFSYLDPFLVSLLSSCSFQIWSVAFLWVFVYSLFSFI